MSKSTWLNVEQLHAKTWNFAFPYCSVRFLFSIP